MCCFTTLVKQKTLLSTSGNSTRENQQICRKWIVKHKTSDIQTRKKHLFLDIFSLNFHAPVPSLYQCASVSTPSLSAKRLPSSCEPLYATNTSHRKQETFIYEYPLHWVLLPTETHNRTLLFCRVLLKHDRHFDYQNQPLNMRMRVCCLVLHVEILLRPL
jgi:hypothetical protein